MSNFTSGWVQYCAGRETGDSRAVTSIQERSSGDFSIPQLFHSEYSIISFIFSSTTVFFLCTCKTTEEQRNRQTNVPVLTSQPYYPQSSVLRPTGSES